jgi:hypothetical protein
VWQRQPNAGYFVYEAAAQLCPQASTGGRFGWRLPSLHELQSLFVQKTIPAFTIGLFLPDGHPFLGITGDQFWTHTKRPYSSEDLWFTSAVGVAFPTAFDATGPSVQPGAQASANFTRMWCVRGGGGGVMH